MPAQQQDYILRHIETIGRLIARLRRKGKPLASEDTAELNETLLLALHLQEKNFGMPGAKFLGLTAEEQMATLRAGEAKATGHERCLTYATLLQQTAELYAYRGSTDLALGARLLALHVTLTIALEQSTEVPTSRSLVRELLFALDGADLPPPTRELLDKFQSGTA